MDTSSARIGTQGKVSLFEGIAANVVNMVGIGPFVTIPLILAAMGGPQAMLGWALGAILALCDGLVWAELGAAMPGSGGTYVYLREAFGPRGAGRLMSFLFLAQSVIAAPLTAASGAVGFADYARALFPNLTHLQKEGIAIAVCLLATALLYRNIRSIGMLSAVMFWGVLALIAVIILTGITHFRADLAFSFPPGAFHLSPNFFFGLGAASLLAMYDYSGYFTVCLIGDEVKDAVLNIPRAIIVSVLLLAACYSAMSLSIIGIVPWVEASKSEAIVSDMMQRVYGVFAARAGACFILLAAFGSIFTVLLGYSRVPYAAAAEGEFFSVFARLHPKGGFPSFAVVSMGLASALACLLSLDSLIKELLVIQALIWFLPQCLALWTIHRNRRVHLPFQMPLYPAPLIIAAAGWLFILLSSGAVYVGIAIATALLAAGAFLLRAKLSRDWPFKP